MSQFINGYWLSCRNRIWFKENDVAVVLLTVFHGPAERGLGERPLPKDVDGLDDDLVLAVLAQAGEDEPGAVARIVKLVHVQETVVLRAAKEEDDLQGLSSFCKMFSIS